MDIFEAEGYAPVFSCKRLEKAVGGSCPVIVVEMSLIGGSPGYSTSSLFHRQAPRTFTLYIASEKQSPKKQQQAAPDYGYTAAGSLAWRLILTENNEPAAPDSLLFCARALTPEVFIDESLRLVVWDSTLAVAFSSLPLLRQFSACLCRDVKLTYTSLAAHSSARFFAKPGQSGAFGSAFDCGSITSVLSTQLDAESDAESAESLPTDVAA